MSDAAALSRVAQPAAAEPTAAPPPGPAEKAALLDWLAAFRRQAGRPLRVLHIGNIANNAYLNAKILRSAGVECDVLVFDYYHIMSAPEWEEADFRGDLGSQYAPQWSAVDLQGYERPSWFVQGPLRAAVDYMDSRAKGEGRRTAFLLARLRLLRWLHLNADRPLVEALRLGLRSYRLPVQLYRMAIRFALRALRHGVRWRPLVKLRRLCRLPVRCCRRAVRLALRGLRYEPRRQPFASAIAAAFADWVSRHLACSVDADLARVAARLDRRYHDAFPHRRDGVSETDVHDFIGPPDIWRRLCRHYDLVQAYATNGCFPLVAEHPYLAFEHGTLRNIPFESSSQGRLCALGYACADHSFITNADNIVAARKLGLMRFGFVPHPINEAVGPDQAQVQRLRGDLTRRLDADFLVFHPARHHWEAERRPDWEKGNDIFIRGFARFVHQIAPRAGAVFVRWGLRLAETDALLANLGIAERIHWVEPQPHPRMVNYIAATDVLADQFFLGAFGSILPKALALGRPAMLYLDEALHDWCFQEMPPVCNTRSEDDVFQSLQRLYREPSYARELGEVGRRWYQRYHSNEVILLTQLQAYRDVLTRRGIGPA